MLFGSQVGFFFKQTLLFKIWAIVSRSSQQEAWEKRGRMCGGRRQRERRGWRENGMQTLKLMRQVCRDGGGEGVTGGGMMRQMKFKERGVGEHQRGGMNGEDGAGRQRISE